MYGSPTTTCVVGFRAKPVGDYPIYPYQLAKFAFVYQFLYLVIQRIVRIWNMARKYKVLIRMCVDKLLSVRLMHGDRFFDQHMDAVLKRVDADGRVRIVRRAIQPASTTPELKSSSYSVIFAHISVLFQSATICIAHRGQFTSLNLSRCEI